MEQIYNKLVRDNIPDIILSNGETPITRILASVEYKQELEKKLYEEYIAARHFRAFFRESVVYGTDIPPILRMHGDRLYQLHPL